MKNDHDGESRWIAKCKKLHEELARQVAEPQAQIDQIQKMGLFTGNRMSWFTALFTLPFQGYLLFIKKYLRKG